MSCLRLSLSGAFAKKLQKKKKNKRQLRHVCPSVRMEQLGCYRTNFREILILGIFMTLSP